MAGHKCRSSVNSTTRSSRCVRPAIQVIIEGDDDGAHIAKLLPFARLPALTEQTICLALGKNYYTAICYNLHSLVLEAILLPMDMPNTKNAIKTNGRWMHKALLLRGHACMLC